MKLSNTAIKQIMKIESVIEFDFYLFVLLTNSTKIIIEEFQTATNRKSKGFTHYVTALTNLGLNPIKDKNTITISHKINNTIDNEIGYNEIEIDSILKLETISEKRMFIFLCCIKYKKEFIASFEWLNKKLNIELNRYRIKNVMGKMNYLCDYKISDDKVIFSNFIANDTIKYYKYEKQPSQSKVITKKDKITKVEIPTKQEVTIPHDTKNLTPSLIQKYGCETWFEDIIVLQKDNNVFVKAKGFLIEWFKANNFDKKLKNRISLENETTDVKVNFIEVI